MNTSLIIKAKVKTDSKGKLTIYLPPNTIPTPTEIEAIKKHYEQYLKK
jgi:hypothetical protein